MENAIDYAENRRVDENFKAELDLFSFRQWTSGGLQRRWSGRAKTEGLRFAQDSGGKNVLPPPQIRLRSIDHRIAVSWNVVCQTGIDIRRRLVGQDREYICLPEVGAGRIKTDNIRVRRVVAKIW